MHAKKMNKMMMNNSSMSNEEFSFPVISNNPLSSNFMLSSTSSSSSSLWRISSRVYHHQDLDFEEKPSYYYDDDYRMEVRSMCEEILPSNNYHRREIESFSSSSFTKKELEVEESMDYLWEDFNEEEKEKVVKERRSIDGDMSSVLKVTKMMGRRHSSGSGSDRRSNSSSKMLMIGKFLKGLVSIRKSASQLKLLKSRF